jgi:hypothetical protein
MRSRRDSELIGRLIDSGPRDCPKCGAILSPIMPLLGADESVIGVARQCANSKCVFGDGGKTSMGLLAHLASDLGPDLCPACDKPFVEQFPALQPDGSIKTHGLVNFKHSDGSRCTCRLDKVPWLMVRPPRLEP